MRYVVWIPGIEAPKIVTAERAEMRDLGGAGYVAFFDEKDRIIGRVLSGAVFEADQQ